jgi:uncharacterized repeat protein (TIGR03803 family)
MKAKYSSMLRVAQSAILLLSLPLVANALTVTTLHIFGTGSTNGVGPAYALVQGTDGNFYGTTWSGGAHGAGTVFRISPTGSYTNLYSFGSADLGGQHPAAGLVQGSDGNFYGTTWGADYCSSCGNIFRISPSGSYTNLHSFTCTANDGGTPFAALVQGSDGNFYGTTEFGGTNGGGVVFRISPTGSYTNVYLQGSGPNPGVLIGALVQGGDGNFYGTTWNGGIGWGTVFRVSPSGSYTNLHSFAGGWAYGNDEGSYPYGGLVQGGDGYFYGTTSLGGGNINNAGTVFRISPGGSYATLYSFTNAPPDGAELKAGLVLGSDGNFYGTTYQGGTNNLGTVFRISPSGQYTKLYDFTPGVGGGLYPQAGLVQGSDGSFYGTTRTTVFKLDASLSSTANRVNGVSVAGTNVVITVASVAGETYQLQYTAALASGIWSNVPGAAVTNSIGGPLTVTNFGGAESPGRYYRWVITP